MVCVDGGLERLIRLLRQVPRSPSQPSLKGVITDEMQSVWKWSLAFQCVVNIGVRGSENVRTRVVEAGMVPVAVRVLESYLRVADAIREERKRDARREEARQRMERAAQASSAATNVTTPTVSNTRRIAPDMTPQPSRARPLVPVAEWQLQSAPRTREQSVATALAVPQEQATQRHGTESNVATPSESSMVELTDQSISAPVASTSAGHVGTVAPLLAHIDPMPVDGTVSPSSSSSSVVAGQSSRPSSSAGLQDEHRAASGLQDLTSSTHMSSVEDLGMSGSNSDAADEADMEGQDSDSAARSDARARQEGDVERMDSRMTPRPPRRALAPVLGHPSTDADGQDADAAAPTTQSRTATTATHHGESTRHHRAQTITQTNIRGERDHAQHHHHHATWNERDRDLHISLSDMIYREEEVLLSLQLLAYLSKYAHVRTLFHRDLATLNMLDPLDALDGAHGGSRSDETNRSWSPSDPPKKNVFCIAERYTLRSSRTGMSHFATLVESRIAPEIQYWAGVIMRNACRKDEKQGGIRQCANMLCGKWEKQPREFAKCRRCRKAKYCSKQCQSKGWQMGHRFWCSARSDDEQAEAEKGSSKDPLSDLAPGEQRRASEHELTQAQGHTVPVSADDMSDAEASNTAHRMGQSEPSSRAGSDGEQSEGPSTASRSSLNIARHDSSTTSPSTDPLVSGVAGRRVTALPQHLQAPGGSRSRTTSATSSAAEVSDMSDDEMERASRRVLHSTVAPPQQSPASVHSTLLSNVVTAGEDGNIYVQERQRIDGANMNRAGRTRTDLAGRPLPPPVIAQHDESSNLNMHIASDGEMLALGGRMTPAGADETEAAVFGRGDFDQMIWRGRTPSMEEQERSRLDVVDSPYSRPDSVQQRSGDEASVSEADVSSPAAPSRPRTHSRAHNGPTQSMLNSALLLAGQEEETGPRFPSSGLHAPHPRAQGRYASVNGSTSMSSGLPELGATAPMSPIRGGGPSSHANSSHHHHPLLSETFGDWAASVVAPSTPTSAIPASSHHRHSVSQTTPAATATAQTPRQLSAAVQGTIFAGSSLSANGSPARQSNEVYANRLERRPGQTQGQEHDQERPLRHATERSMQGFELPGDVRGLFTAALPDGDVEMGV